MPRIATRNQAHQIALLHKNAIAEGFLTQLGIDFLTALYRFLIKTELVLVYEVQGKVVGFVSCSLSVKGLMKRFVCASPDGVLKLMGAILKRPSLIKSLLETFNAPTLSGSSPTSGIKIPVTELLSIAVDPSVDQVGIGTTLLKALEAALKEKGIYNYKVVAGSQLKGANQFYLKHGFVLANQITIHGTEVSNVYVKSI